MATDFDLLGDGVDGASKLPPQPLEAPPPPPGSESERVGAVASLCTAADSDLCPNSTAGVEEDYFALFSSKGASTPKDDSDLADLLGTNANGAAAVTEEDDGELVEFDLNDSPDSAPTDKDPGNLLDCEGWNLRHKNDSDNEEEDADIDSAVESYRLGGAEDLLSAKNNGEQNTTRRGLFGWGNRRSASNPTGSGCKAADEEGISISSGRRNWAPRNLKSDAAGEPVTAPLPSTGRGLFRRHNQPSTNADVDATGPPYNNLPQDGIDEAAAYGEGGITGDDDLGEIDMELDEEQKMDNHLRPGDHIFIWQTYGINPRAYQRHAVVVSVTESGEDDPLTQPQDSIQSHEEQLAFDLDTLYSTDDVDGIDVTVVSFYHFRRHHQAHGAAAAQAASSNKRGKRSGCKRELLQDFIGEDGIKKKKPIHKVRYGRKVKKGLLSQKAGVGTALKKDQVGLILARVDYVLEHPDHLPDHNALSANGECASLWCVTGRWCTLQGASILAITSVGQAGGALLAGGILSNLTVLVPMPGLWGMAGWWWYVPATVAYPFLVPMLVALGMASLVPLEILRRNRKKWRAITDGLNHEFWTNCPDAIKEEYFGQAATAEAEAETLAFFGVRENEAGADDAKYMPLGGTPGGMDDDSDEEDEALAYQRMEDSCQNLASEIDLSGKPPAQEQKQGGWGSFVGSFRRGNREQEDLTETERFHTSFDS